MGIGTYFYEYNPEFSPELQVWGHPTQSLVWLAFFLFLLIVVFQLASRRPRFSFCLLSSSYYPLINLSFVSSLIFFPIAFLGFFSGAVNRYELNPIYKLIISYFSPLGYIPSIFMGLLFCEYFKSFDHRSKTKNISITLISLIVWFSNWILLKQKGTPFVLSFCFFISPIIAFNINRLHQALILLLRTWRIRRVVKSLFSITKTLKSLLSLVCVLLIINLVFTNLKTNLSYDSNQSKSRILELYLYNRVARQGQLFSTSFSRPVLPSGSNNIETQILGRRFFPNKYVGMQGVMDFLMPFNQRLQHTGSLTMLFPAINISIFGPVIGLIISVLMCFSLTILLAFQINHFAESLARSSWLSSLYPYVNISISLLLFKYYTNILFRGELSNILSPYFLLLFLSSVILNRKKTMSQI